LRDLFDRGEICFNVYSKRTHAVRPFENSERLPIVRPTYCRCVVRFAKRARLHVGIFPKNIPKPLFVGVNPVGLPFVTPAWVFSVYDYYTKTSRSLWTVAFIFVLYARLSIRIAFIVGQSARLRSKFCTRACTFILYSKSTKNRFCFVFPTIRVV